MPKKTSMGLELQTPAVQDSFDKIEESLEFIDLRKVHILNCHLKSATLQL